MTIFAGDFRSVVLAFTDRTCMLLLQTCMLLLQACMQYMDSLQELQGILGSDTCSQLRNDPCIQALRTRLGQLRPTTKIHRSMSVDRPFSASAATHDARKPRIIM